MKVMHSTSNARALGERSLEYSPDPSKMIINANIMTTSGGFKQQYQLPGDAAESQA